MPGGEPPVNPPLLETRNLEFEYPDGQAALGGISLRIERGEFIALIGQNGSGKTTLAKHFNGLLRPTRGQVLLNGEEVGERSVGDLARTIGYVFQNPDHQIFSATTREEIAFGPANLGLKESEVAQRTQQAMDDFDLTPYANLQPALLSFGLRRKVSVAAVYAMRTQVLILDEPSAGLDWRGAEELMRRVADLNRQGHTILLITHDMRLVAAHAARCLLLRAGSLLADGPTRQILGKAELLRQTDMQAPQITELGHRLASRGMSGTMLSVAEFCTAYGELKTGGEARHASRR